MDHAAPNPKSTKETLRRLLFGYYNVGSAGFPITRDHGDC